MDHSSSPHEGTGNEMGWGWGWEGESYSLLSASAETTVLPDSDRDPDKQTSPLVEDEEAMTSAKTPELLTDAFCVRIQGGCLLGR
mmetsp:Transcript_27875/g.28144  ORF Transcript_27875/g.28144 Transcript_27875/m.28144 type:complete len:85 (-) Transcript_27875:919-1173(-)